MIFFLTTHSLWVSGAIIVGLGTVLSMLGPVLVRRYADLNRLRANNEIAGFKFATIGVVYAVLLAFSVVVVWGKYSETEANVVQEAGAAEDIYRLSQGLSDKARVDVASSLRNYLKAAINDDWPSMDRGAGASARRGTQRASSGQGDNTVISEMLRQLDRITQSRRARLVASDGAVPGPLWLVLLGGAAITIGFTFFLGTENLGAQVLMTALLALLIFSELLIIVAIDRPFSGAVKLGPNALAAVLADVEFKSSDSGSPRIESERK